MNKIAFQPLVILDKKPILTQQRGQNIRFPAPPPESVFVEEPEEGEIIEEQKLAPPAKLIIDKRKTSRIDRNLVLERLKNESVIKIETSGKQIVPEEISRTETVIENVSALVPIKTSKRLILKPKEVLEIPETIMEEGESKSRTYELKEQEDEGEEDLKEPNEEFEEPIKEIKEKEPKKELKEEPESSEKEIEKKTTRIRKLKINKKNADAEPETIVDLTTAVIRTQKVTDRLPKEREHIIVRAPTYYMNNRKIFIQKLVELFKPYQSELLETQDEASCDRNNNTEEFQLLTHQKVVRDYLNLYTPYRGLLLYFLLGTGKTCSAIAIAEGMKSNKRVFVLTPKSLKQNFFNEMKKCGDQLYKKNQYWEFVSIEGNPDYVAILSKALSLSTEYIRGERGAWLVNVQKEANFTKLDTEEQKSIDKQLNEMIRTKYTDINYNGLNMKKLSNLTGDFSRNPFDNAVVIVDEAHNFVSRIVNKINKPKSLSYMLYDYILDATNAKIVFLSGTPIINYPNEIGIMYNMLRGYIKTWTIPISWDKADKLNTETILKMLDDGGLKTFDYVDYADNVLTITRNPFGFINTKKKGRAKGAIQVKESKPAPKKDTKKSQTKRGGGTRKRKPDPSSQIANKITYDKLSIGPEEDIIQLDHIDPRYGELKGGAGGDIFERYNGVQFDETGNISDDDFIRSVIRILKSSKNGITVREQGIELKKYKSLPDDSDAFINMFVNEESGDAKNINLFQRRILGLTSYFRSANEKLLPNFVKTDEGDIYHLQKTEMSAHQFEIYERIRKEEADRESKTRKKKMAAKNKEELFSISSTYRIFSRAACNFTFPTAIERPLPGIKEEGEVDEAVFDKKSSMRYKGETDKELLEEITVEDEDEVKEEIAEIDMNKYEKRIEKALGDLNVKEETTGESIYLNESNLRTLTPKFAKILENLKDPANEGLHLLYSHFRTIEGVGIMRLILLANGFAEFKIKKVGEDWTLIEEEEDAGKPKFALHTGTETDEEKEITLRAFNGDWNYLPSSIAVALRGYSENNMYGEAIKLLMITASGAEGINLKNTRFVHIAEPYWHMVRIDQVIGRARRICSHAELPEEMRTVKVFLYISTLSEAQRTDEKNVELRIRDVSRIDKTTPITTDESLYEIASIKQRINNQILRAVKESAVDCNLYSLVSAKKKSGALEDEQLVCYGFGKVESNQFSSYPSLEKDSGEKVGLDVKEVKIKAIKVKIGDKEYALNEKTYDVYDLDSYNRAIELGTDPVIVGKFVEERGRMKFIPV